MASYISLDVHKTISVLEVLQTPHARFSNHSYSINSLPLIMRGRAETTNTSATIQTKAKGTDATTHRTHTLNNNNMMILQNHNIQAKSVQYVGRH